MFQTKIEQINDQITIEKESKATVQAIIGKHKIYWCINISC
jgi:hypothetical protein